MVSKQYEFNLLSLTCYKIHGFHLQKHSTNSVEIQSVGISGLLLLLFWSRKGLAQHDVLGRTHPRIVRLHILKRTAVAVSKPFVGHHTHARAACQEFLLSILMRHVLFADIIVATRRLVIRLSVVCTTMFVVKSVFRSFP